MKKEAREALDAYFAEADSWANDRNRALRKSRSIAWWVAGGVGAIAICEALALAFLAPLKTVEPYTLLVDRQTGFVQALKPLNAELISADKALTQSFLVQYVIAREGFDINSVQSEYRKVMLWSADSARQDYSSGMQASNPNSPLTRLPRSAIIDVRVKSVTSLSKNSAMVRYDTVLRDGAQQAPSQSWVTVVRFGYSGEPMSAEDRMINPLGFKVTRFRRSMETLPQPEAQTAPSAIAPIMGPQGAVVAPPAQVPGLPQAAPGARMGRAIPAHP
ncbi:virB8 family protein [Sphingobium fuliginis]|uniref:Bacterial virulence protein VirB8 domain-containing protein n=1 Tax=Sphingobium fuliginis ATCC 27551 TaxID=1208342 RepID=A0A5B8CAD2_SPHSA|nr:VirB8/TrbF family protein [Sphingobium fuliginis]QDC36368.1 hypothetical protein FIL70_03025 [Sphingobium fuliginis ATCC 27551]